MMDPEQRALRMVEESAREIKRICKPRPYTLEERLIKRLTDSLDSLDRSRERAREGAPDGPAGGPESVGRDPWPVT